MTNRRWLDGMFGWGVSAGFHLVLLLGAALVFIEQLIPVTYGAPAFSMRMGGPPPVFEAIERPRDLLERCGLLAEEDLSEGGSGARWEAPPSDVLGGFVREQIVCNLPPRWRDQRSLDLPSSMPRSPGRTIEGRYGFVVRICGYPVTRTCGSPCTESAVVAALRWLARHQGPDGGWSSKGSGSCCAGSGDAEFDDGVTALAVLAFLGAGYTPLSREESVDPAFPGRTLRFGTVVKRGIQWLLSRQDPEGCVGPRGAKFLYGHAIATLALCEAYGMTATEILREPAQRAVDFLAAARNPGAAWRYGVRSGENDTSVTGWAVMALKSAELSELAVPRDAVQGALAWIDQATARGPAPRVGYTRAGSGKVYIPGRNESFDDHPTMSAIGLASRILLRRDRKDAALAAAVTDDPPAWSPGKVDFYYWYYGTLALFQFDGPAGPRWKAWGEPTKDVLVRNQKLKKDGCANGSWDSSADRWGSEGGRVYATALNALTLEIYYRYANVFGGTVPR